ncbi:MAG TPA: response regulator [Candidatus Obscuribacterales bacterium]
MTKNPLIPDDSTPHDNQAGIKIESLKQVLQGNREKLTGELVITGNNQQWHLYFLIGRLLYATGGKHRVRRWYRALKCHAPNLASHAAHTATDEPWEYELLKKWVTTGQMQTTQARAIIQSSVQEVLFELLGHQDLNYRWLPDKQLSWRIILPHVDILIEDSYQLQMQWQNMGLSQLQAHLVPMLIHKQQLQQQVSPEVFITLEKLLNGKHSFWDIAHKMQQRVTTVTRSLIPFMRQGIIKLHSVPDLPAPLKAASVATVAPKLSKHLIACIDDSPTMGKALERILNPAGYEVLSILDPVRAISILLECKPKLIFLDLVMPNTNGYELCSALRKTSAFRDTPIIILTAHDGMVDRLRAKMCGSSGFMAKPPVPAKVLQVVDQYLKPTVSRVFIEKPLAHMNSAIAPALG